MEKEFIPYEQALDLKELGFNEPCAACYYKKFDNEIGYHKVYRDFNFVQLTVSAPTFSQAFRFFREKHNEYFNIHRLPHKIGTKEEFMLTIDSSSVGGYHKTYEEAELECLKKLIEIVKQKVA